MKLIYTALIAVFLTASCTSPNDADSASAEAARTPREILADNPAIKTGLPLEKQVGQRVQCAGRIEIPPSDFNTVHARTSGFVTGLEVMPGDQVKKGQRLLMVEDPELLEKQRLLAETSAELKQAEAEYNRQKSLQESEASSARELEEAASRYYMLEARLEGLTRELDLKGIQTRRLLEDGVFQSAVAVSAPVEGYIHAVRVNQGQHVHPEDVLIEMASESHVHLELQVLPGDVALVGKGQVVHFGIPQDTTVFTGSVLKLNRMLSEESGTLQVHCLMDQADHPSLRVGMRVWAEILGSPKRVTGLPLDAVILEGETWYGFALREGTFEKVRLQNARRYGDFVSFTHPAGETMVTAGAYYLE